MLVVVDDVHEFAIHVVRCAGRCHDQDRIDLPLSGGDAAQGIPTRNGAVLAVEEANAKGVPGGFKFVAYDLDDAVQGATTRPRARRT